MNYDSIKDSVDIDEEIDQYDGDLRAFLLMLRDRFDEEKLKTVVASATMY